MDWREEYRRKTVSADEAVKVIKSGDRVVVSLATEPKILPGALWNRRNELHDVELQSISLLNDQGWYTPGFPAFKPVETVLIGDLFRPCLDDRRGDFLPTIFSIQFKAHDERPDEKKDIDVFMTVVSPPNINGFCSFGAELWNRASLARRAKKVIAEVDERQIWTYGANYIHVSEIDHFVEYTPPIISDEDIPEATADIEPEEKRRKVIELLKYFEPTRRVAFLLRLKKMELRYMDVVMKTYALGEPDEEVKRIAENIASLLRDGDTIQVGVRHPSGLLPRTGIFNRFTDLGYHGEMIARGIVNLIKEGVINGKRKTIHRGKAIMSTLSGADMEEVAWAAQNPKIELYDSEYVVNIKTISANDNMVSINNVIAVDFTGQINSETTPGWRLWSGTGGQPESHIGAVLSKGGRAITLLRSTAMGGSISRIVPLLDHGAAVTIPRYLADYVVTEWGIARLMGKPFRERAEELIAIAHPDFREDLRKEARKMFYP